MVTVIGRSKLHIDQIDGRSSRSNEEDFHDGVVDGDEVGDKIKITSDEYNEEE